MDPNEILGIPDRRKASNGVGNGNFAPKNVTTEEDAIGYANAAREQALLIAMRMAQNLKS